VSIIHIRDVDKNIGDSIMAAPAICAFAKEFSDCSIRLQMANEEVQRLMAWPDNVRPTTYDPTDADDAFEIGVVAALGGGYFFKDVGHPTQQFYALLGLDVPCMPQQPALDDFPVVVPAYDYLIAPWSKDPARGMRVPEVEALVDILGPNQNRIGILGARGDEPLLGFDADDYIYGETLSYVANLMRACKKAVITTDSACSRLAHAAGISNHALIATTITPLQWQMHPKASVVYAAPHQWRTRDLLAVIEAAEQEKIKAEAVAA